MGLDDIDEDEPVTAKPATQVQSRTSGAPAVVAPAPAASRSGQGVDLDALFGGIPTTTVAPARSGPPASNVVPDLFGAGWAAPPSAPSAPAAATAAAGARSQSPATQSVNVAPPPAGGAVRKSGDFLDDLFSSASASSGFGGRPTPSTTASVSPVWQSPQTANLATTASMAAASRDTDLLGSEAYERRQHTRTADDLLEAFEAKAKGRSLSANGGIGGGPRLGELRGSDMSYTALAANAHMQSLMNYYDFLGVAPTASEDEIRRSYKAKALHLHPDKRRVRGENVTDAEAELFKTITKAHEVLVDPQLRAAYDAELRQKDAAARSGGGANWLMHLGGGSSS